MATTFVGAGLQRAQVELERVGDVQRRVRVRGQRVLERGHERPVELDDVHVGGARREVLAEHAQAAADLQDDVAVAELGRAAR